MVVRDTSGLTNVAGLDNADVMEPLCSPGIVYGGGGV